jgi:hypothetical protein
LLPCVLLDNFLALAAEGRRMPFVDTTKLDVIERKPAGTGGTSFRRA